MRRGKRPLAPPRPPLWTNPRLVTCLCRGCLCLLPRCSPFSSSMVGPPRGQGGVVGGTRRRSRRSPMGDSEDEFREVRGGLKAGAPKGGRRPRRGASLLRTERGEAAAKRSGKVRAGGGPPSGGDPVAAGRGGGGGWRRPVQLAELELERAAPDQQELPTASAEEEEEEDPAGSLSACQQGAGRGGGGADQTWMCRDVTLAIAVHQELQQLSPKEAGLVLCQICQKDLSAMNSAQQQQHVNRCLDDMEKLHSSSARGPGIPECPICGRGFSTLKSRGGHLKRCAVRMEISPTVLLQAVRQQSLALGNDLPADQSGLKRKGASSVDHLAKKRKTVAKKDGTAEDLLVAIAMSRSLLEEEKAKLLTGRRQDNVLQIKKPPNAGKKSRARPGPPLPPLLRQDPQKARQQTEERVALLLSEAGGFSSTPPLPPSQLMAAEEAGGTGRPLALPKGLDGSLWEFSSLTRVGAPESVCAVDFTCPVLSQMPDEKPALGPGRPTEMEQGFSDAGLLRGRLYGETQEGSPGGEREKHACSLKDVETLQDLVELAGEGLTLTQWNLDVQQLEGSDQVLGGVLKSNFVQPLEKQLLQRSCCQMLLLGSLADAFRAMVNNPHLSDIQFQVDSGEILYAHMFVLYARCPQLMEMADHKGITVAEEGGAQTRRVLLNDVPGEAVALFLKYLYTADHSLPRHVLSEVAALATRFGVTELADLCGSQSGITVSEEEEGEVRAETFEELLKSMWLDEDEEALLKCRQQEKTDLETVGEQELEEIYEFAATQGKAAQDGAEKQRASSESKQSAGKGQVVHHGTSPRKVLQEPSADMAVTERKGNLHLELPPWKVCDAGSQVDLRRPPFEPEQDTSETNPLGATTRRQPRTKSLLGVAKENLELHEKSGGLFSVTQGECSELFQQSQSATQLNVSLVSKGPGAQKFPSLFQGPESQKELGSTLRGCSRDLGMHVSVLPLVSSPKLRTKCSRDPSEVLSRFPSESQPSTLRRLSSSQNSEQECAQGKSVDPHSNPEKPIGGSTPSLSVNWDDSLIVVLDSDEEVEREQGKEQVDVAFSFTEPSLSGQQSGASECKLSLGADVPSCQRLPPHSLGPGEPLLGVFVCGEAVPQGQGQQLLRLSSDEEDNWDECLSWREGGKTLVPDTPPLGRNGCNNTQPTVKPPSEEQWTGETAASQPTPSKATSLFPARESLKGLLSAGNSPPGSGHVVVVYDSEEELEAGAPLPWSASVVPGEEPPILEEAVGSVLPITAYAKKQLLTPPQALGGRDDGPPAGSHVAQRSADSSGGSRRDCDDLTEETSHNSSALPLTLGVSAAGPVQNSPDLACRVKETLCTAPQTPMPSYSVMETPKLKEELSRFGVRALPKRQMVLKLKEIFQYTHQRARSNSQEQALHHSPAQPVLRKPKLAVASNTTQKQLPGFPEPRLMVQGRQTVSSFRNPEGGDWGLGQMAEPRCSGWPKETASSPAGSPHGSANRASQESAGSSGTDSEAASVASQSFSAEVSMLTEEEEEHVPETQAAAHEALQHYIHSKPSLCRQILLYRPIELAGLQAELKQNGIKIAMGNLVDFLDAHCITFTTAEARREKQHHLQRPPKKGRRRF
ncbi:structure-specific endonuclease subunit SLX4 isoform X2 [Rhineura floridana]|uniref:structure-specific endonuclease subunit SLX4 isoform X2 n=1 Tax=Rhineura floridana TaxID=261503 RepID=UPI002AC86790|nr:structure-specific endonuclease subunit SLX4 isoform X2 [Rhineura floridana]